MAATAAMLLAATTTQPPVLRSMLRPMREVQLIYNATHDRLANLVRQAYAAHELPPQSPSACAKLSLNDFLGHAHHGSIRWDRAASLAAFIDMCKPRTMLEVGSFLGLSSHFYSRLLERWGGTVVSVDPNKQHRCFVKPRVFYHRMNHERRVRTHDAFWAPLRRNGTAGPSNTMGPRDFLSRGERFDMAFIDGDHDEASVMRDFRAILQVMNPGGCVIFDDVHEKAWPGTYAALQNLQKWALDSMRGTVIFGDQVAVFIDRGLVDKPSDSKAEPPRRKDSTEQPPRKKKAKTEAALRELAAMEAKLKSYLLTEMGVMDDFASTIASEIVQRAQDMKAFHPFAYKMFTGRSRKHEEED